MQAEESGRTESAQRWPRAGCPLRLQQKLSSDEGRAPLHSSPRGSGSFFVASLKSQPGGGKLPSEGRHPAVFLPGVLSPTPVSQEMAQRPRTLTTLPGPPHYTTRKVDGILQPKQKKAYSSMCPGKLKGRIHKQVLRNETTGRERKNQKWVKVKEEKGGSYQLRSEKRNGC